MNKINFFILVIIVPLYFLSGCAIASTENDLGAPKLKTIKSDGKTTVSIKTNSCGVSFEYFDKSYKYNNSVIIIRRDCLESEETELLFIDRIIEYLSSIDGFFDRFDSVLWGGLGETKSKELSIAAMHSEQWKIAVESRSNSMAKTALKIVEDVDLFYDLKSVFYNYGLMLRVESVEKLQIGSPSDLNFGVKIDLGEGDFKIPFQGIFWFSLSLQKGSMEAKSLMSKPSPAPPAAAQ